MALELRGTANVEFVNGDVESEFLLLQGKPIGEALAQHGPFVMNTRQELQQAFADTSARTSAAGLGPTTDRSTTRPRVIVSLGTSTARSTRDRRRSHRRSTDGLQGSPNVMVSAHRSH